MKFIIGIDEAGRGPLAGPVAVGAVMVSEGFDVAKEFPGVADSKKLSEKKREQIFRMLEAHAAKGGVRFAIEFGSSHEIDEKGISIVVREAVACGVCTLAKNAKVGHGVSDFRVLLDGSLKAPAEYEQETIINGDELVPLISLASIAAKVSRDRLMCDFAKQFPAYGFEKHKGYGTKAHYEALIEHGLSPIHRCSFIHIDFSK